MRYPVIICFFILFGLSNVCFGAKPIEVLQQQIDEGLDILRDPRYQDAAQKKLQQEKLWDVTQRIFDFEEFSRRVLGSHWKHFPPRQRDAFTGVFSEFLCNFYLRRLQARYNGEQVFYVGQTPISKSHARVEILVLWKNLEVPVDLRMMHRNGTWKVYDISALGISAVGNYRAQFHSILKKKSPEKVIDVLREKIRKIDEQI